MGVAAARANVSRYRELAAADPGTYEPELGLHLYDLCRELNSTGGTVAPDYLNVLNETIALYRRLLRRIPRLAGPLGMLLDWLALAKFRLGQHSEARDLIEESLSLVRRSDRTNDELSQEMLAVILRDASRILAHVGDHAAAVSAAREALMIVRDVDDEQPGTWDGELAVTLNAFCAALLGAGQQEKALAPAGEAVEIARRLRARGSRADHLLARMLDMQASAYSACRRWEEALPVASEAVQAHKQARRSRKRPDTLAYALALLQLSKILLALGNQPAAKYQADRACFDCLRRMWRCDPRDVAETASSIAEHMTRLGEPTGDLLVKVAYLRINRRPRILG